MQEDELATEANPITADPASPPRWPAVVVSVTLLCVVLGFLWLAATAPDPSRRPPPGPAPTEASTPAAVKFDWGPVVAGDEFSYTGSPRSDKWSVYDTDGHAGKGLRRPDAWYVDGSAATVTGDSAGRTGGMSARFGSQKYGRWEARMRTSVRDPEYHAVLLLWPDSGNWPADGEIDYAEGTDDLTRMKFFLHYGADNSQIQTSTVIDSTEWHHYAVEWTPQHIVGYIDGVEWFRDENTAHHPPGPMHQTVQLDWFPDGTTTKETTMSVDWVRVYELG